MQIRLPAPGADEQAHSQQLRQQIAASIQARGPMPFSAYMDACLYTPGLGYYSAGATKFGAAGDFVTAPELGGLFAACVAQAIQPCLAALGPQAQIMELGGGSGALAADLLLSLSEAGLTPASYRILEPSADLRERQRRHLQLRLPAALYQRVEWLDAIPSEPWQGVVLANEVIDALPAARFVLRAGEVLEEYVDLGPQGQFEYRELPAGPSLVAAVRELEATLGRRFEDGYRSELRLQLSAWLDAICASLKAGLAVWVDYGYPASEYYLPERDDGTLMAYFRHRAHGDPFHLPGLDDLTASVDFSGLARAAVAAGLAVEIFTSQAQWLLASGLQSHFEALYLETDDTRVQMALAQQVRKLTMPEHMGERFQVMLLGRGDTAGFGLERWSGSDRRYRL
ncbi:class I SAM-dependent methyltransferase [Frateuria aurantia]